MRYSIRLAGLQHCGEELEQAARRQRQEIDELDTVIRRLSQQWCMDDVTALLRKERQKMEEQVQLTLTMAQAARRCYEVYRDTENAAIDGLDCPRHVISGRSGTAGGRTASAQQLRTASYAAVLRDTGVSINWQTDREGEATMASSEIAIDTTALSRDVNTLSSTLRRVQSEVEGMYEAVRSLDRMWDGPANEAFVQQFRTDYANMQALCRAVEELIRCMQSAGAAYTSGEKRVESIVSSIRI